MKVDCQHLDILVAIQEEATKALHERYDDLVEEKKLTDTANEDLFMRSKAQDEINHKQVQTKLNRDKSEIVRDLQENV